MPTYGYTCDMCGFTTWRFFNLDKQPKSIDCVECDARSHRDIVAEQKPFMSSKPYHAVSTSLAVDPDEVEKTIREDRAIGSVADDYLPDGRLVFKSMKNHREYARIRGYADRDGYF